MSINQIFANSSAARRVADAVKAAAAGKTTTRPVEIKPVEIQLDNTYENNNTVHRKILMYIKENTLVKIEYQKKTITQGDGKKVTEDYIYRYFPINSGDRYISEIDHSVKEEGNKKNTIHLNEKGIAAREAQAKDFSKNINDALLKIVPNCKLFQILQTNTRKIQEDYPRNQARGGRY